MTSFGFAANSTFAGASWWRSTAAAGITVMGFDVGALLLSVVLAPVLVETHGDLPMVFFWLGTILTAWSAAGVFGPLYVGYLMDQYPDRAVTYCFLIGVVMLVFGYIFTFLLRDNRIQVSRPTVDGTLREFGIEPRPRAA